MHNLITYLASFLCHSDWTTQHIRISAGLHYISFSIGFYCGQRYLLKEHLRSILPSGYTCHCLPITYLFLDLQYRYLCLHDITPTKDSCKDGCPHNLSISPTVLWWSRVWWSSGNHEYTRSGGHSFCSSARDGSRAGQVQRPQHPTSWARPDLGGICIRLWEADGLSESSGDAYGPEYEVLHPGLSCLSCIPIVVCEQWTQFLMCYLYLHTCMGCLPTPWIVFSFCRVTLHNHLMGVQFARKKQWLILWITSSNQASSQPICYSFNVVLPIAREFLLLSILTQVWNYEYLIVRQCMLAAA